MLNITVTFLDLVNSSWHHMLWRESSEIFIYFFLNLVCIKLIMAEENTYARATKLLVMCNRLSVRFVCPLDRSYYYHIKYIITIIYLFCFVYYSSRPHYVCSFFFIYKDPRLIMIYGAITLTSLWIRFKIQQTVRYQ